MLGEEPRAPDVTSLMSGLDWRDDVRRLRLRGSLGQRRFDGL